MPLQSNILGYKKAKFDIVKQFYITHLYNLGNLILIDLRV